MQISYISWHIYYISWNHWPGNNSQHQLRYIKWLHLIVVFNIEQGISYRNWPGSALPLLAFLALLFLFTFITVIPRINRVTIQNQQYACPKLMWWTLDQRVACVQFRSFIQRIVFTNKCSANYFYARMWNFWKLRDF